MRTRWPCYPPFAVLASQVWVALAISASVVAAKWTSLRLAPLHGEQLKSFLTTPVLSVSTWRKRQPRTATWVRRNLSHFVFLSTGVVASWMLYARFVPSL